MNDRQTVKEATAASPISTLRCLRCGGTEIADKSAAESQTELKMSPLLGKLVQRGNLYAIFIGGISLKAELKLLKM